MYFRRIFAALKIVAVAGIEPATSPSMKVETSK